MLVAISVVGIACSNNAIHNQQPWNSTISSDPNFSLESSYNEILINENLMNNINSLMTTGIEIESDKIVEALISVEGDGLIEKYKQGNYTYSIGQYAATEDANEYVSQLIETQQIVYDNISENEIDVQILYSYTTLFNGFAVKGKLSEIRKINALPYVKGYEIAEEYSLPEESEEEDKFITSNGIFENNSEYQGEGMFVAVLDAGFNAAHSVFSKELNNTLWDKADMQSFTEATRLSGTYYSSKIPYMYDYADEDNNVLSSSNHGTHVAGILTGNDDTIRGVAPYAQLALCKVFTDDGYTTSTSVIKAVSDMVLLGVDVINMSLGASSGFTREVTNEIINTIYDSVADIGITLCVSAGNSYYRGLQGAYNRSTVNSPDFGLVGSPSSYASAFTVASLDTVGTPYILDGDGNNMKLPIVQM
jgi:Subtilisin-like serine proteases